jgi:hypothetical protein
MARLRRYLNCLNGWDEVGAAVEAHSKELPHMEMVRPELLGMLEEARSLVVQVNALTASKQEAFKKLQQVLRSGEAMVDVMRTAARQRFGPDSEILVEFGVNPFRGRPRASETETPESPTPTPAPETTK